MSLLQQINKTYPNALFNIMIQRHYSPDQINSLNHSLEKQLNPKLREAGSTSNLLYAKTAVGFKEQVETIGHYFYRKKDEIGSGYTSHVYKCKSHEKQGQYAIKVIELKKYSASSLQMLDNQIEILKKLNHPNIIRYENVYKTVTHCYLITEYCQHGDLLEYMTNNGKLCEKEAIFIISEVIQATKYLLKMGVIHRDIKPANIFKHSKSWKLGDFGFSINSSCEIKTRHNVGTPLYMPIQSLMRNVYSPESDIFSVGVILYEMMIGVTPWECRSEKELLRKMATTPFNVPQKFKISSHIKFLLSKMCAVNKDDRMSKEEFLELNIHNFNSLINFNEVPKAVQPQRKGRLFSVGKNIKQQPLQTKRVERQYLINRKKSKNQQKSVPKVQARTSSKKRIVDAKSYGNNSRKSSSNSSEKKFDSKLQIKNCEVLICQLNYCRFMYYIIENSNYLPLNTLNKGRICLVLFKHILKVIKQLSDGKNNWFGFTNWDSFRKSAKYDELHKTLKEYCEKYEKQYLAFLKKAEINVIKEVNQKLPQFSTNEQFSIPFYRKVLNFLSPLLKQCIQSLSLGKLDDGNARYEGLKSLFKYFRLNELSIKQYQNYTHFCTYSQITILKNYRTSEINMNEYMQIKQQIKQI